MLPHIDPQQKINVSTFSDNARLGFDLRAFCQEHGLDGAKGGGAHMWREVWDETVGQIYTDTLSKWLLCVRPVLAFTSCPEMPEPKYGLVPKVDPYKEFKSSNKYAA